MHWSDAPAYWDTIELVDVDTDGKADVCGRSAEGLVCALSVGTAFGEVKLWSADFDDASGFQAASWWETMQYGDVDGDGRLDVCARRDDGVVCAVNAGDHFAQARLWTPEFSDALGWRASPGHWRTIRLADVNGDGRADVCGRGSAGIICATSDGERFNAPQLWTTGFADAAGWGVSPYFETLQFVDVNADGRADVCGRGPDAFSCGLSLGTAFTTPGKWSVAFTNGDGWGSVRFAVGVRLVDVSGDGIPDLCGRGDNAVYCQVSSGSSVTDAVPWTANYADNVGWGAADNHWATVRYPDVDGDGKADICGRGVAGIWCGPSNGESFDSTLWTTAFSNREHWADVPWYWHTIQFADVNGDGRDDVCGRAPMGMVCAVSAGERFGALSTWSAAFAD